MPAWGFLVGVLVALAPVGALSMTSSRQAWAIRQPGSLKRLELITQSRGKGWGGGGEGGALLPDEVRRKKTHLLASLHGRGS